MIMMKGVGIIPTEQIPAINRTGSTLTVGGVYALDLPGANSNSTDAESNLTSLVLVTAGNINGQLVVALDAVLADLPGKFMSIGRVQGLVDGTTDVAEGDALVAQIGSINLRLGKSGDGARPCAQALAAQTANAGTLTDIWFDGRSMFKAGTPTQVFTTGAAGAIVENIAAETQFDGTVIVPKNTIKAGDVIHIHGYTQSPTATNSTETLTISVRFGPASTTLVASGTVVAVGPALDAGANSICVFDIWMTVLSVGATGTFVASGIMAQGATAAAAGITAVVARPTTHTTAITIDTTVDEYFGATLTTSSQNAADEAYLEQFIVEVLHV